VMRYGRKKTPRKDGEGKYPEKRGEPKRPPLAGRKLKNAGRRKSAHDPREKGPPSSKAREFRGTKGIREKRKSGQARLLCGKGNHWRILFPTGTS